MSHASALCFFAQLMGSTVLLFHSFPRQVKNKYVAWRSMDSIKTCISWTTQTTELLTAWLASPSVPFAHSIRQFTQQFFSSNSCNGSASFVVDHNWVLKTPDNVFWDAGLWSLNEWFRVTWGWKWNLCPGDTDACMSSPYTVVLLNLSI